MLGIALLPLSVACGSASPAAPPAAERTTLPLHLPSGGSRGPQFKELKFISLARVLHMLYLFFCTLDAGLENELC